MRTFAAVAVVCAAVAGLSACQTPAPYEPAASPTAQGWSQQLIERDRWRVTYRGAGDAARVHDRALRRAAELTLEEGRDWFVVDGRWAAEGRDGGLRPGVSVGAGHADYGRFSSSGVGVGVGLSFGGATPSQTSLDVRLGSGPRPEGAHDAREVAARLAGA